jgi:hypothetical protein
LHHSPDLLVATDDRIELAAARRLSQVACEARERLVLVLGRGVGHPVRAAHRLERLEQLLPFDSNRRQQRLAVRSLHGGEREEQMLGRHVRVAQISGVFLGAVDDLVELTRERGLRAAGLRGVAAQLLIDALREARDVHPELLQHGRDDALLLREQRAKQVRIVDERIARLAGERERRGECLGGFDGEAVGIDHRESGIRDLCERYLGPPSLIKCLIKSI